MRDVYFFMDEDLKELLTVRKNEGETVDKNIIYNCDRYN